MPTRRKVIEGLVGLAAAASLGQSAEKYSGPVPAKHDVPYLLHADNLIETEAVNATQSAQKTDAVFVVGGETSWARTPLAEPIFLFVSERISPASLGLYQFDVRNGRREIVISKKKGTTKMFHTAIKQLSPGLFRIEASDYLENGEYSLSPEGENIAFCFTVY
jgi:hypothetical protein